MQTLIANINKSIQDNEIVTIGGGQFNSEELIQIIKLYEASKLAEEALSNSLNALQAILYKT